VPARVVSVRWPHKRGNHTWVEIWDGQQWRFCGADEPDPKGLDRAWFTRDASKCVGADREHRIRAVSYENTGERFRAGWGRGVELWGIDVTERYAPVLGDTGWSNARGVIPTELPFDRGTDPGTLALAAQLDRFFAANAAAQQRFEFDRNLYPTKFTLVEGHGHGGLPDRDLLAELVPHVRNAAPKQLSWQPSDGVVKTTTGCASTGRRRDSASQHACSGSSCCSRPWGPTGHRPGSTFGCVIWASP